MRFAVVVHPRDLAEVRRFYPLAKRVPNGILSHVSPYLPPARIGQIQTAAGVCGDVIVCPLIPYHFAHLGKKYLRQKVGFCLQKAERLGAQVVGLDGLTAFFVEEGQVTGTPRKVALTSGLRLRTQALYSDVRLLAKKLGISWSQAEVVLVGAAGQEGRTWVEMLAQEAKSLTLLKAKLGNDQGFAGRIMYETGLALKVSGDPQLALSKADIVFLHHLEPGLSWEPGWYKSGSVVCSILPDTAGATLAEKRKDLKYLENVNLELPPGITWSEGLDLSAGLSAPLAETLILAMEKNNEWIQAGREITIKQVRDLANLARKYGFKSALGMAETSRRGDLGLGSSIAKP